METLTKASRFSAGSGDEQRQGALSKRFLVTTRAANRGGIADGLGGGGGGAGGGGWSERGEGSTRYIIDGYCACRTVARGRVMPPGYFSTNAEANGRENSELPV